MPRATAQDQDSDINTVLKLFPGYHVLTLEERDAETRSYILNHFAKANPSVIHVDIAGDGQLDFALLLRQDKSKTAKLVILLCSEDVSCKKVYDLDLTGYAEITYLRPVPVGSGVVQTDAIDTKDYPRPVRLAATGIEVTYLGKAKVVCYWNKKLKKVVEVQTED